MIQSVTTVTPPAAEPVTLAEAKAWLRITDSVEDTIIGNIITTATEQAEQYTRRAFINRTLKLTLDRFPLASGQPWWDGVREMAISELTRQGDYIDLPFPPLVSITSVTTFSRADASSVMPSSDYRADTAGARICLSDTAGWPTNLRDQAAIEIVYVAGYGASASNVPMTIRQGILAQVAELYHSRDCGELCSFATAMLSRYRVMKAA
jgi:hypothetical protein